MGRYEGLVKLYKSKTHFFKLTDHHPQASCHVCSGRESPAAPDRILDAPHLSISWCMDCPSAQQNIWVTLAKTLQQDSLCLSMGSVDNPLSMCLVGFL